LETDNSIFKTPDLEKQYMDFYETVLSLWNLPHQALDVTTRFGTTHINAAGSVESPAMVLFPGFGANSTMWFPNIAVLSSRFRVYAVDTNGQPDPGGVPAARNRSNRESSWNRQRTFDRSRSGSGLAAGRQTDPEVTCPCGKKLLN